MKDYLLFLDTETSGLPKKLINPTDNIDKQPYIVQVAWIICTNAGEIIREENHYIGDEDYTISPASGKIHGITREFLKQNGEKRKEVMQLLYRDIEEFDPMLVGYYIDFDIHMLEAAFYRAGIPSLLQNLPSFCTMRATANMVRLPNRKYLGLGELYKWLFEVPLDNQHNAQVDTLATYKTFFKMLERGDINEAKIEQQLCARNSDSVTEKKLGWKLFFLGLIMVIILIFELI